MVEKAIRKSGYSVFLEECALCPYVEKGDVSSVQKKQWRDIERREKRVLEKAKLRYEKSHQLEEDIWDFIVKNKEKRYGKNELQCEVSKDFFDEVSKKFQEKFVVEKLFVDEVLVAVHMGFQDNHKY